MPKCKTVAFTPLLYSLVKLVSHYNLPEGSCAGSRLQLMKQPHGMWIQRSESTNSGVTAGASSVRKKLSVSREELCAFAAWRTSTDVCERIGKGTLIHSDSICMMKWGEEDMNETNSQRSCSHSGMIFCFCIQRCHMCSLSQNAQLQ